MAIDRHELNNEPDPMARVIVDIQMSCAVECEMKTCRREHTAIRRAVASP